MSDVLENSALQRWQRDPISFINALIRDPVTEQPFELCDAQKQFFNHCWKTREDGRLLYPEQCFGAIKKSGKTGTAAMHVLTTTLVYGGRFAEAYVVANDFEQAQSRVFAEIKKICEASPLLKRECEIYQSRILFPQTNACIQAIGSDATSAAGGHPCVSSFDELWGFCSERSRRLYEELVPIPSRRISCRLVTTHAGYSGESSLLEEMYNTGLALPKIAPNLHAGNHRLFFWSHEPLLSIQTASWLEQMRETTRPIQFLRQFENRFVTSESSFIDLAAWDRCVDPQLSAVPADMFLPVYIGVDASTKRDSSAIVAVTFDQKTQKVRLVFHRIFQPSQTEPLDFELSIEATLLDLKRRFQIRRLLYDPFQMQASAQRLIKAGVPNVEEYPQTLDRLTATSQQLYDLITGQAFVAYPSEAIRLAISRTVAIEGTRGWRIGKTTQSHKVDVVIALSLACFAAVRAQGESNFDLSYRWVDDVPIGVADTVEARKARTKKEADDYYQTKLVAYLDSFNAFGRGPPWGQI
jgi:phage terminase large subunit-like protein